MKKFCIYISAILFFSSSYSQNYNIKITIDNWEDSVGYLGYHFGHQKYVSDTSEIKSGQILFKGDQILDKGVYFLYSKNAFFEFIISDDKNFKLTTSAPDFVKEMKVDGSVENKKFFELQKFTMKKQKEAEAVREELNDPESNEDKEDLKDHLQRLNKQVDEFRQELQKEIPDSYLAKFIKALKRTSMPEGSEKNPLSSYIYSKNNFFKYLDLSDEDLLRSPLYHPLLMEYLDKVIVQNPDSIIEAVDLVLQNASSNDLTYRYILVTLANKYERSNNMGFDKIFVHLAEKYYLSGKAEWADDEFLSRLRERVNEIKPNLIGKQAPSMALIDPQLKSFDLSDINAKFTVLYFYDPDCAHCKKKTPVLYSQYAALKEKGVEIIGVNVTTDVEKWRKYIKENTLDWINGADPDVRSNFRYEYDIRTTPTVYILDDEKKIIAKKIAVEDVPGFIDLMIKHEQAGHN